MNARPSRCPCGSGETAQACCVPLHRGERSAPTAEALMRSRYSAFALRDKAYLLSTWHPSTRPDALELDAPELDARQWVGLDVLAKRGGLFEDEASVEFVAHYRLGGEHCSQHETGRFVRDAGRWFYLGPLDGAGQDA